MHSFWCNLNKNNFDLNSLLNKAASNFTWELSKILSAN